MELQGNGRIGVDARVEGRRQLWIMRGVGLGPWLRGPHGDLGLEARVIETLVRPNRSRWASLDGTSVAWPHPLQPGVKELLLGVGLGCRCGLQELKGVRVPRQDIEPV